MRVRSAAVPADRLHRCAPPPVGWPAHQRQILAADLARRQLRDQPRMRLGRARHDQQAAGVLVEPMHQPGARHARQRRIVRQQRVLQRVLAIAGARMHHQARRLVQHQQRAILDARYRSGSASAPTRVSGSN